MFWRVLFGLGGASFTWTGASILLDDACQWVTWGREGSARYGVFVASCWPSSVDGAWSGAVAGFVSLVVGLAVIAIAAWPLIRAVTSGSGPSPSTFRSRQDSYGVSPETRTVSNPGDTTLPISAQREVLFCTGCGAQFGADDRFCARCGRLRVDGQTTVDSGDVISPKGEPSRRSGPVFRRLGEDPVSSRSLSVRRGRHEDYVTDGVTNVYLGAGDSFETMTLSRAIHLLQDDS